MTKVRFPKDFIWGSATAAHQVEGNNTQNDWFVWENEGHVKEEQKSGVACDHYNRFKEDIDVLASLNQNAYRFSIEWSRIEPRPGEINMAELEHYRHVLEYLHKKGIVPFVTLHHFTNPTWLDWESPSSVDAFVRHVTLVVEHLGDLVEYWMTINEPNILAKHGWLFGDFPPGKKSMVSMFAVLDHFIAAHNQAYEAIHKIFPKAKVGMAKNNGYYHAASESSIDQLVVSLNHEVRNKYFLDRTTYDFIGLNYYSPKKLRFDPGAPDQFYGSKVKSDLPISDMGWEIFPEGLLHVLLDLGKRGKPIYITENGLADATDKRRKDFITGHLLAVHKAMCSGVNVLGYFYWSLMDNFEWGFGYGPRFGLLEVDYKTQKRKIRDSARFYAEICKSNTLDSD